MKRLRAAALTVLTAAALFAAGVVVAGHPGATGIDRLPDGVRSLLVEDGRDGTAEQVVDLLERHYVRPVDGDRLLLLAARGVVARLGDPRTRIAGADEADAAARTSLRTRSGTAIGRIRLTGLGPGARQALEDAAADLVARGADALALDLRGDLGGHLDAAREVLGAVLPEGAPAGAVVDERGGRRALRSEGGGLPDGVPVVVLVDGSTAGAAEAVAGALHDAGRGVLVGERTAGEGWATERHDLGEARALVLASGRYVTARGVDLSRRGLEPEVAAPDDPATGADETLARADREAARSAGRPAPPIVLVYDTQDAVRALARPEDGQRPLTPARGALRQQPGTGGMFSGGDARRERIAKVSGAELATLTAEGMAELLRGTIRSATGVSTHLVAVDELTPVFGEPAPADPQVGQDPPPVDPESPGARLARAMASLDEPSPWGGTWASRVHFYVAPAVHSAIAAGRGPEHNLGRDGKPHLRTWRALAEAIGRAGGTWLEMYHYDGSRLTAFSAEEWRATPTDVRDLLARHGAGDAAVHFLFAGVADRPPGAGADCGPPMACQWRLAESTPAGREMLRAGPGAYRLGDQAPEWLRELNRRFR